VEAAAVSDWHVSRAVPIDRDTYMVVEGIEPPPITGVRIVNITWVDRLLARLFVAYAIWKLVRG
jgi:hypothetical protein